jgi:ring-1,2-phenylacetyl-CoA epoxidase subunit PaaC
VTSALVPLLLALGDDELVLGHRHSEWTGWAPHIEEDVAFSSIAQDEIGHAAAYYALASKHLDRTADEIAFGRSPGEYRNALMCERPNGDWAFTLARHWLYDHAEELRLESLEGSSDSALAGLATKMRREERYHLLHADMWLKRLAHGPMEGRSKLVEALGTAYPDALALFDDIEGEDQALKEGLITTSSADLRERFQTSITEHLENIGLSIDATLHDAEFVASSSGDLIETDEDGTSSAMPQSSGGREGSHTSDFEELWDVMTLRYREDPKATW